MAAVTKETKKTTTVKKVTGTASATTETSSRGRRVELQGEVIANKMNKTISVLVYRMVKHAKYGKYIRKSSVIKAHDEHQKCKVGDTVKIYETKPISKTKHWSLSEVLSSTK